MALATGLALGLRSMVAAADPLPEIAAELARLEGHRVQVSADGRHYRILDVAGDGAPLVGVVERRGRELWLRTAAGPARRLRGPLAVPRIAGPGYKVWVVGRSGPDGSLVARRLGVLAPPQGFGTGSKRSGAGIVTNQRGEADPGAGIGSKVTSNSQGQFLPVMRK